MLKVVKAGTDKGTTTVIMNKEDKIREGHVQVVLDQRENYESLAIQISL